MSNETKICPFCGGEILATAKKCKHCKQFLAEETQSVNNTEKNNLTKNFSNKKIIIGVVCAIIFVGFIVNSSKTTLSGCSYERTQYYSYGRSDDFICKNQPYTLMTVYTPDGDYPKYTVYKGNDQIAERKRSHGDYECSSRITKDSIQSCSMAQFEKLAKNAGENVEIYNAMIEAKSHINGTLKEIREIRRYYQFLGNLPNSPLPSKIDELIGAYKIYYENNYSRRRPDGSKIPQYEFNGYQAKAPNGNILSFSEDLQYLTIYDSENPKYYITVKMNFKNLDYEVTDKIISAEHYINNANSLTKLSEEYMDLK